LVDLIIKENSEVRSEKKEAIGTLNSILDIGTGSGCIAITLKKKIPSAEVCAIDISEKALEIAKANAKLNEVKIEFIQQDILSDKPLPLEIKFDVIVSNPPYVRNLEMGQIHKNVLDYEPHLALFVSDEAPLIFYKAIADYALKCLKTDGKLYFEINEYLADETMQILLQKGFNSVEVFKDINGKNRILRGKM
jgi:release factor glutamine methyltransferase